LLVQVHERFVAVGEVHLPYALARKYSRASPEWCWQYLCPSKNRSLDAESRVVRRHYLDAA